MFCMYCGQQLPDGAKFCLNCGTPQGAVSPTGTIRTETIYLDGLHTFVPAMCPNCNAHMKVDTSSKVARCDTCGTECLVQDAIKALTVRGNVQVGSATINVNGTNTDALIHRIEIMLADGDFREAKSKCDTLLDSDPTNGKIYLYMLMSQLGCRNRNALSAQREPFDNNKYYLKVMEYGDTELKNELQGYINLIKSRKEAIQKEIEKKYKREVEENHAKLKNPKVGDEFYFGTTDEIHRLWWKVLRIQDRMALIISIRNTSFEFHGSYHSSEKAITWADCSLREWLNNYFIDNCFSSSEQSRILPCRINNDKNPDYNTPGGVATNDKVFLLSINEAYALFANDKERADGQRWWLRSPGRNSSTAAFVDSSGVVRTDGFKVKDHVRYETLGIRPALWIKLDD